ncbi:Arm DNA-binding domain-containing protein [Neptunomonas phycophila]|uniref:Arm DNA-binding domain-containing protein n=1 Tax=Neptunomonas phycophila TaxID=1572645 RepID=UPI003F736D04
MLTDTKIRNLKPKEKLYKINDRDGLYVAVTTTGTKSFRYNYSINGCQETITFGCNASALAKGVDSKAVGGFQNKVSQTAGGRLASSIREAWTQAAPRRDTKKGKAPAMGKHHLSAVTSSAAKKTG